MIRHMFITCIFFIPIFAQNPKTITGTIQNTQGKLWNDVFVELFDGNELLGSTISTDGLFEFDNVLTSTREIDYIPNRYALNQNYPNPFNPSTIISYHLPSRTTLSLKVYDILGKEVKTLVNAEQSSGDHSISWNGTNNNNQGVSAGVYFYRLIANNFVETKKMILTDGAPSQGGTSNFYIASKITKTSADGYYLKFTGDSVMTKIEEDIDLSEQGDINLGVIEVPGKPIVTGFVYDLDNKYNEDNNRLTPPGLEGKKVYFGSDTSNYTYTNANGRFYLMADTLKTDSVFVVNPKGDTTHYNWRRSFELQPDGQEITAFNDTTGIPMFKQFVDSYGRDMLTYIFETIRPQRAHPGTIWAGTLPRVRDEDLPIKVYLNRAIAPVDWYPDSAYHGLKISESGRYQFVEVNDSNKAIVPVTYNTWFWPGGGVNIESQWDEHGVYLTNWEISIKGDNEVAWQGFGTELLPREFVSHLLAHEQMHLAYAGGWHTDIQEDMFSSPYSRWSNGYPLKLNPIEARTIKLIYDLERNSRLPDYFK